MQQADQCQRQHHVLQPHGKDHTRAGAHQHGSKEIDQKGIGKTNAGKGGIFRRQVVALGKAVDDLKMQRQVAQIVSDPGINAVSALEHRSTKDHPQQNGDGEIENQIAEAGSAGPSRLPKPEREERTR